MNVPIATAHLFPKLDAKLIELLRSLAKDEWGTHTLAKKWTVKDVAAHLLDGNIRLLSVVRDEFIGQQPGNIESYADLVAYLNQLNADWVQATKRMSASVLIELLETTGKEYSEVIAKLDPHADAIFSVAWAGQKTSPNWFHVAREYTEKWHHQQQIREAVNKPGIMTPEFFFPLIDTFMRALPYTYRTLPAEVGDSIRVHVETELGGDWILERDESEWQLVDSNGKDFDTEISIDPDTAWKLFTNAIGEAEAGNRITIKGNQQKGLHLLKMRSVMV